MHRRLSPTTQQIIKHAERIARQNEQEYIDTDHILLAIAQHGKNKAADLLERCGVTPRRLQKSIEQLVKKSLEETWVFGRLPGTPHFRNVVARAIELAEDRKAQAVEPEHLLLALTQETGSVGCQALAQLGVDAAKIREFLDDAEQAGAS